MWPWVSVDRHCAKIFVSLYFDIDNKFPVNFYIDDSLTKTRDVHGSDRIGSDRIGSDFGRIG